MHKPLHHDRVRINPRYLQLHTFTSGSISSVSLVTCTGEAPRSVGTISIKVTVVSGSISTLINI